MRCWSQDIKENIWNAISFISHSVVTRGNFTASSGFSACQTKLAGKSNWENNGTKALREGARIIK